MTTDQKDPDLDALEAESIMPVKLAASLITVDMALYDKANGEIIQVTRAAPEAVALLITEKVGVCEIEGQPLQLSGTAGWDFIQSHIVDIRGLYPKVIERPPCPAVLDGSTLRGLPLPCKIRISRPGQDPLTYDEDDERDILIDFDHTGTYTVTVIAVGYMPGNYMVTIKETTNAK